MIWLLYAVAMCCLVPGARASSNAVQTFQTITNESIVGVLVRNLDGEVVIATADDVVRVKRRDLRQTGVQTKLSRRIDEVLTDIERQLRLGQYVSVESNLGFYDTRLAQYERDLEPSIKSSATPPRYKEALENAITYYRDQRRRVQPTIVLLQQLKGVDALHEQYMSEQMPANRENLQKLGELAAVITEQREKALAITEPMVQSASDQLSKMASGMSFVQRAEAMEAITESRDPELAAGLMRSLSGLHGVMPEVATTQEELLDGVLQLSRSTREEAVKRINESIGFSQGGVAVDTQVQTEVKESLAGVNTVIDALTPLIFGKDAESWRAGFAAERAANLETSAQAQGKQSAFRALDTDLEKARRQYGAGQYAAAITTYESLSERYEAADLELPNLATSISRGLLQAQAMQRLQAVRNPGPLPPQAITNMADVQERWLQENREALPDAGFEPATMAEALQQLRNLATFRSGLRRLQSESDTMPLGTWIRIIQISEWLNTRQDRVHPAAFDEWRGYLDASRDAAFQAAVSDFRSNPTALKSDEERRVFRSFIDYYLDRGELAEAQSLARVTVDHLHQTERRNPFIPEVLKIRLSIAKEYAKRGNHNQAVAIFEDLERNFPSFAQTYVNELGEFIYDLANEAEANGELQQAANGFRQLCDRYPAVANTYDVYQRLLTIELKDMGELDYGDPALLDMLNERCVKYPGRLASHPVIADLGDTMVETFVDDWESGEGVEALRRLQGFSKEYPGLARETQAMDEAVRRVLRSLRELALREDRPVPPVFIKSLEVMFEPEFREYSESKNLDQLYVALLKKHADESIRNGQYTHADGVYAAILNKFPEIAEKEGIRDLKDKQRWRRRMQEFTEPLRLNGLADYVALALWIIFWSAMLYDAVRQGRRNGFMRYRLMQLVTVFGIFLALLTVFLFFHQPHALATVIALVVPGVILNVLGLTTYFFFPLVYVERRLAIERFLSQYIKKGALSERLQKDIARLEDDMPVLHDRRLFLMERARRAVEAHPERAYDIYSKVIHRLDQEIIKDDTWRTIRYECLLKLGMAAQQAGREDEAVPLLRQYLEFNSKHMKAQRVVADYLFRRGDYSAAVPHLKVCLTGAAQDDELWWRLGRCFFETDRPVAAYKCFETAQERNRDNLFYSARAYARAGKLPQAIKFFQQVLKQDSGDGEAIFYLASALAAHGEDRKALKVLRLVPDTHPQYAKVLALRGNLELRGGNLRGALAAYDEALQVDGDLRGALLGRSQVLIEQGKTEAARESLERLLKQDPDLLSAQYFLGVVRSVASPDTAIACFEAAKADPVYRERACRRLARLYFSRGDHADAVEQLEAAYDGEPNYTHTLPSVLFLHAWSVVELRADQKVEEIVEALIANRQGDPTWDTIANRAIYRLGVHLFEAEYFHLAGLCFGRVGGLSDSQDVGEHIQDLIREMRFRQVVKLHQDGEYGEAAAELHELQSLVSDDHGARICRYYIGLNMLFQENYVDAQQIFDTLHQEHPDDPRMAYHLAVAELGRDNHSRAAALAAECDSQPNLAYHLKYGVATIRAYLEALRGRHAEAAALLEKLPVPPKTIPGGEYVRERMALARIFYLCHTGDVTKIQFLIADLPESARGAAAYLQAVANLGKGNNNLLLNNLQPYAGSSERNRRLFTAIAVEQCREIIDTAGLDAVRHVIDLIPRPEGIIAVLQDSFIMHDVVVDGANGDATPEHCIAELDQIVRRHSDVLLLHSIGHNLRIFHLMRAIAIEDSDEDVDENDIWQECLAIWRRYLFDNRNYWNVAMERLGSPGQSAKPFNAHEIDVLNQKAKDDNLITTFRGFAIAYLTSGDFGNAKRHLAMIRNMGQADGRLQVYMAAVLEEVENVLKRIDKNDPVTNTWDFVITSVALQLEIHETLGNSPAELKHQLELYLKTRENFNSPADFNRARRLFNTAVLDTLQIGIRGQFVTAGERLQKVLNNVPPGLSLGLLEREMMRVREYCRDPEKAEQNGVRLEREFEKLYQKVRHYDMTKGTSDAYAPQLV